MSKNLRMGVYCFVGITVLLLLCLAVMQPNLSLAKYRVNGGKWILFTDFVYSKPKSRIGVASILERNAWSPQNYTFWNETCISEMVVNAGNLIHGLPHCKYQRAFTPFISQYLTEGENWFWFTLSNVNGGKQWLLINPPRHRILISYLVYALGTLGIVWFLYKKREFVPALLVVVVAAGILLRLNYLSQTPFWLRGHDAKAHVEYIRYVEDNWKVPPRKKGWEFYHPPVYYFLMAGLLWGAKFIGHTTQLTFDLQMFAMVASIILIVYSVFIARRMFPKKKALWKQMFFVALIVSIPSFTLFSVRVNNDALVQLCFFVTFFYLLEWWDQPSLSKWVLIALLTATTVLTKMNGLLLIPILFTCLLFHKGVSRKVKLKSVAVFGLIFLVTTGTFFYQRIVIDDQDYIVANAERNNKKLRLSNDPKNMLIFNPVRVISKPYNAVWDAKSPERGYFFEYFFRSAFFGEFKFHNMSSYSSTMMAVGSAIMLVAFVLMLYVLAGLVHVLIVRDSPYRTVILSTAFFLLLGHILLRITPPTGAPGQDFRHSTLLIVPVLYFLMTGISIAKPIQSYVGKLLTVMLIGLNISALILITI